MPRILDQHRHAGALHDEIQLLRFVNETVFQTKSGSFGMALEVSGLDPECRLEADLDNYSRRLERALKTLDERFRLYQYVIKRFDHYCTAATMKLTPTNPQPSVIATAFQRTSCDFVACMEWKPQSAIRMRSVIKARKKTFAAQSVSVLMAALAGAWTSKTTRKLWAIAWWPLKEGFNSESSRASSSCWAKTGNESAILSRNWYECTASPILRSSMKASIC